MEECTHKNTKIWEPHLAGARKCVDCGMVFNPNRRYFNPNASPWFDEDAENEAKERAEYERLKEKYNADRSPECPK